MSYLPLFEPFPIRPNNVKRKKNCETKVSQRELSFNSFFFVKKLRASIVVVVVVAVVAVVEVVEVVEVAVQANQV